MAPRVVISGLGLTVVAAAAVWLTADRLIARAVNGLRPSLEQQLSTPLGHPIEIGPYRGLGLDGIGIGPIRIRPGTKDASTLRVQKLSLGIDPLSSIRHLRLVVVARLHGASVNLSRNQQGQFWVPGPRPDGEFLHRVDLRVRLVDPAKIRVEPANLQLSFAGAARLRLNEKWADGAFQIALRDRGSVTLKGRAYWDRPEFQLTTQLKRIRLNRLQGLLPMAQPIELGGQVGGDLSFDWNRGQTSCGGGLSVVGLTVSGKPLKHALASQQLRLHCAGDRLTIPRSQWRYGPYRADLGGQVHLNKRFDLIATLKELNQDNQLAMRLDGDWSQPRFKLAGKWRLPEAKVLDEPVAIDLQVRGDGRRPKAWKASLETLALKAPGVSVKAEGALYPLLDIKTKQLQLVGKAWKGLPLIPELLGTKAPLNGELRVSGPSLSPRLQLALNQDSNPLLERWSLQADWSSDQGLLSLNRFSSPQFKADAVLPLQIGKGGLQVGALESNVRLQDYPLSRIGPLLGTEMDGTIAADGEVRGPLQSLQPDLQLEINSPRAGAIRLVERWEGRFEGRQGGGGQLQMASVGAVISGSLAAQLGGNWFPETVRLQRRNGELQISGSPALYRWTANDLSVDGLEMVLPPKQRWEGVYGRLSGSGDLSLQPWSMSADLKLAQPGLLGIQLRQALLTAQYKNDRYDVSGELLPRDSGQITFEADGYRNAGLNAKLQARGLSARWLTASALSLPQLSQSLPLYQGDATDLGSLLVNTFGGSLDGQLRALKGSQLAIADALRLRREKEAFHPEDLRGQVDAVVDIQGPSLNRLDLDLTARGHLWIDGDDKDIALQVKPFIAELKGPLQAGKGSFSLAHLPFSLLALVAPVPPALQGALGLSGRYRLGEGEPVLTTELVLEEARVGQEPIALDRGQVLFANETLQLDLALRAEGAEEPLTVIGQVPLKPDRPLDVRVESHGDGLHFLAGFSRDVVAWSEGDTDLRLLIGGSLLAPEANGFIVMNDGKFVVRDQIISKVNSSILFDFDRLEVQEFKGRIGRSGTIQASGALKLFNPAPEDVPLTITVEKARIKVPTADVAVAADLLVSGALVSPDFQGNLQLSEGAITPQRSLFSGIQTSKEKSVQKGDQGAEGPLVSANTLLEEDWNFKEPLVLLGPNVEEDPSRELKASLPNMSFVNFDNLRLKFGPGLSVQVQPIANFKTEGLITVNGPLDPNIELRGVLQLLTGRVSVFTSTFNLDRKAANVAVFTPTQGLIPYVDIAMETRVSDSVNLGVGSNTSNTSVFDTNGTGTLGAGGQLRLIKVMLQAEGQANRLADSIQLRSSPPMPQPQLLGLIGGNSLAGLTGAGAGTALAAVLGQSLLSPVLGTFTDAFNQRLQFALYPTYVMPTVNNDGERVSGRVPPQLAIVTDFGVNISDRFDLSILAAPNRNDIPPQGGLSYQIDQNLSVSGSVDSQGTWQSQLQLFFRF
ncbi:translocation/assembly module TamB domain-containing protein [bacterium]|nr:translocation/assembly module TamB domain-containing protein [bacterium]